MNKFMTMLIAAMIALIIITLFTHYDEIMEEADEDAVTTFAGIAKGEDKSSVDTFFYYSDRYISVDDRKQFLQEMMRQIGVENKVKYTFEKTKNGVESVCDYEFCGGKIETKLITVEKQIDKRMSYLSQYISVHMEFNNSPDTAFFYKEKLRQIFEKNDEINIEPDIYLTVETRRKGVLSRKEKEEISNNIFDRLKAKRVYDEENNYDCVYGYSGLLTDEAVVGDKSININIAFGYDEETDDTIIYQAFPIINSDF